MATETLQRGLKGISLMGMVVSLALCIYGWQAGVFSSPARLQQYIGDFGIGGGLVFVLLQVAQVIVPIVPGGLSCLAGVVLFGAWKGFVYNYVGICIGSVLAFLIARTYGRPLLYKLFNDRLIARYDQWTTEKNHFAKLFAIAIFLPVAPDDFLCYLAGTTEMSLKRFTTIIILGKPLAIVLYSMGLMQLFSGLSG